MKKLSSDTRCNASDKVMTEIWSTKYNIPKPLIGKGTQGLKYQRCKAMHVSSYITWTDNRMSQISIARKPSSISSLAKNRQKEDLKHQQWIPKGTKCRRSCCKQQH